jgi:hypothetical protein
VFGCFQSESWKKSNLYYGNGMTFVFTVRPSGALEVYKWAETSNSYFVLSKDKFLAVGGG